MGVFWLSWYCLCTLCSKERHLHVHSGALESIINTHSRMDALFVAFKVCPCSNILYDKSEVMSAREDSDKGTNGFLGLLRSCAEASVLSLGLSWPCAVVLCCLWVSRGPVLRLWCWLWVSHGPVLWLWCCLFLAPTSSLLLYTVMLQNSVIMLHNTVIQVPVISGPSIIPTRSCILQSSASCILSLNSLLPSDTW